MRGFCAWAHLRTGGYDSCAQPYGSRGRGSAKMACGNSQGTFAILAGVGMVENENISPSLPSLKRHFIRRKEVLKFLNARLPEAHLQQAMSNGRPSCIVTSPQPGGEFAATPNFRFPHSGAIRCATSRPPVAGRKTYRIALCTSVHYHVFVTSWNTEAHG